MGGTRGASSLSHHNFIILTTVRPPQLDRLTRQLGAISEWRHNYLELRSVLCEAVRGEGLGGGSVGALRTASQLLLMLVV